VWLEGLGKLKKSTSSWTRTSDLPACSIVLQPAMLPCVPITIIVVIKLQESCVVYAQDGKTSEL
jgi:hypothetical protein